VRTVYEIRRENLKYLIQVRYKGVPNQMAKQTGIAQMQLARIFLNSDNRREVGDRLARRIEEACSLEPAWMDTDHSRSDDLAERIQMLDLNSRQAVEKIVDAMIITRAESAAKGSD